MQGSVKQHTTSKSLYCEINNWKDKS